MSRWSSGYLLDYEPRGSGSIPEVRNLEICILRIPSGWAASNPILWGKNGLRRHSTQLQGKLVTVWMRFATPKNIGFDAARPKNRKNTGWSNSSPISGSSGSTRNVKNDLCSTVTRRNPTLVETPGWSSTNQIWTWLRPTIFVEKNWMSAGYTRFGKKIHFNIFFFQIGSGTWSTRLCAKRLNTTLGQIIDNSGALRCRVSLGSGHPRLSEVCWHEETPGP